MAITVTVDESRLLDALKLLGRWIEGGDQDERRCILFTRHACTSRVAVSVHTTAPNGRDIAELFKPTDAKNFESVVVHGCYQLVAELNSRRDHHENCAQESLNVLGSWADGAEAEEGS